MKITSKFLRMVGYMGLLSALVIGGAAGLAWADETTVQEQALEKKGTAIDGMPTTPKHDEARIQALAKQFNVPESRITELRNKKMGWGEVTISLAMAEHLASSSKTPMTTEQALTKIEQLRSEKMGWGKIAKELGFKLGPVVSSVERSEQAVKSSDRQVAERLERKEKAEHAGKMEQAEKADRMERAERHERVDRPERPARPERAGH